MHESGVPLRQRDRDTGTDQRPLPRFEHHILGAAQIGAGVRGTRVARRLDTRIETGQQYLNASGHDQRDYPGVVRQTASDRQASQQQGTEFSERLYLPWYHWLLPLVAAGLLAAEIHMGYPGVRAWLPYLILFPLVLVLLIRVSWMPVAVRDGELWVGDAHIPVEHIGEIELVDPEHRRKALGPELDPSAFVRQRGWIKPLLRVEITDERDPTPYWVVSTRHPRRLVAAIDQAQSRQTS